MSGWHNVEVWGTTIEIMPRAVCAWHGRYIDATGLCPTCQREARQQAETRANNEAVRRIAVEAEAAVLAEMWGLL